MGVVVIDCIIAVRGEPYRMTNNVRDDKTLRDGFNQLTRDVYGFDFEKWFDGGWWSDTYLPYLLLDGDRVVANVSVNIMDFNLSGEPTWPIQIGTVMTHPEYRHKGLSSALMSQVIDEWNDQCDGIYLFANNEALGFYSKMGFVRGEEVQFARRCPTPNEMEKQKLNMDSATDRNRLLQLYRKSNPFSACSMEHNEGLLMFYCADPLKDSVYYLPQLDAAAVVLYKKSYMVLADVFCDRHVSLEEVLGALALPDTKTVLFGFAPQDVDSCRAAPLRMDDTTLLILSEKENLFSGRDIMLPILSHA